MANAKMEAVRLLLQTKGEYRTFKQVAVWIQEAQLPEFAGLSLGNIYSYTCWCCRQLRKAPQSIHDKEVIAAYLEDTEALIQQLQLRVRHLKDLLHKA